LRSLFNSLPLLYLFRLHVSSQRIYIAAM
jgi:hypothetical protein